MKKLIALTAALCVVGGIIGCGNADDTPSTTPIQSDKGSAAKEGGNGLQPGPAPSPTPVGN